MVEVANYAELFAAGGPYAMTAVLLSLYLKLWRRLSAQAAEAKEAQRRHEERLDRVQTDYVRVTTENAKAATELAAAFREFSQMVRGCERWRSQ